MMRRLYSFLLVLAIMFGLVMPCYAEEKISDENKEIVVGDVYAKYMNNTDKMTVSVKNGHAVVETDNKYIILFTDIPDYVVTLRVMFIPSSETTAWNWFSECIGHEYVIQSILDIWFEDAGGNRVNVSGVNVEIVNVSDNVIVFSVSVSGKVKELNCSHENEDIVFKTDESYYYVLTQKDNFISESEYEQESNLISNETKSPATGDENNIIWWSIIMILSFCIGILIWKKAITKMSDTRRIER